MIYHLWENKELTFGPIRDIQLLIMQEIEIGGQPIDRQYGEWMDIWSELTTNEGHVNGLKTMIGKNTTDQGIEASEKRKLIVPLQFWFVKILV